MLGRQRESLFLHRAHPTSGHHDFSCQNASRQEEEEEEELEDDAGGVCEGCMSHVEASYSEFEISRFKKLTRSFAPTCK